MTQQEKQFDFSDGYIKLYRKFKENIFYKNSEAVHLWLHLLFSASFEDNVFYYKNTKIERKKGQLITGRKKLSQETGIGESTVFRLLKLFESEHLIEQQTSSRNRLISIINWNTYQSDEQPNKRQVNNNRTTTEQQVNTPKEVKKGRSKESIYRAADLSEFSIGVQQAIRDWLTYKEERNESYKETGLKAWLGLVRNKLKSYEDKYIIDVIERSMASQYKGVVWDWLKDSPKKGKYKEYREEVKVADTLSAEEQAENIKRMQERLGGMF